MAMRLDAYQAVKEKKVSIDVKPIDSYKRTQVDIRNNTQHDIDLDFSKTAFIPAGNSDAQRLGLTYVTGYEPGTYIVSMRAETSGNIQFETRCLDYRRPAPANGLLYNPMSVPLPNLIAEMMKRGMNQQDIWYDIENTPSLKASWQSMDPRGSKINPGSVPISATISIPQKPQTTSQNINISGVWTSNIGFVYNIVQKGNTFTWTVIQGTPSETGQGQIQGTTMYPSWQGTNGSGSTTATIIITNGKATEIRGSNGVIFYRK